MSQPTWLGRTLFKRDVTGVRDGLLIPGFSWVCVVVYVANGPLPWCLCFPFLVEKFCLFFAWAIFLVRHTLCLITPCSVEVDALELFIVTGDLFVQRV